MSYALIIIATVLIAYFTALHSGFVIDDIECANNSPKVKSKNKWHRLWQRIRGTVYQSPQEAHFISVLVHLVNCLLIYFCFGRSTTSFLAALLFAVNPALTQGSVWLSGRGYAISTMMVLLMWKVCPLFFFVTPFFAFNAILAPLLFIGSAWWWIGMIPLVFFIDKGHKNALINKVAMSTKKNKQISPVKIIIFFKSLGYYTCFALFPTRLGIYHKYLYTYGLSKKDDAECERIDKFFFVGVAVIYVLVTNLIWNYSPAVFGLLWFVLFIGQWCNIIQIQQAISDRYAYLPTAGMMFFLSSMMMSIPDYTIRVMVFTAFIVFYFVRLQLHIPSYKDLDNCIDYNALNFPELYVIWTWRGQLAKQRNSFFTALEYWFRGWRLRPVDFRLNNNIAVMLTDLGYLKDAEEFLNNAEANMLPEHTKIAGEFIAHERARIAAAKEILRKQAIGNRIITDSKGGFRFKK
jgi:MFS family permease